MAFKATTRLDTQKIDGQATCPILARNDVLNQAHNAIFGADIAASDAELYDDADALIEACLTKVPDAFDIEAASKWSAMKAAVEAVRVITTHK